MSSNSSFLNDDDKVSAINLTESIIHENIYIINDKKYCELRKLKNTINNNKTYELELIKTSSGCMYDDLLEFMNMFLIADLIKIIYEYLKNKINLTVGVNKYSIMHHDVYFVSNNIIYNFYTSKSFFNFNIDMYVCPTMQTWILQNDFRTSCEFDGSCQCKDEHYAFVSINNCVDGILYVNKYISDMTDNIDLMYTIFKYLG